MRSLRNLFQFFTGQAVPRTPAPPRRFRPTLEGLEKRDLMSTLNYMVPSNGMTNTVILKIVGTTVEVFDNNSTTPVAGGPVLSFTAVNLYGNAKQQTIFEIEQTGLPTTVNLANASDVVTVGSNAPFKGSGSYTPTGTSTLQGIQGSLSIKSPNSSGSVIVDDSGDTGARTATISATSGDGITALSLNNITGLAPATISYGYVTNADLFGSAAKGTVGTHLPPSQYTITGALQATSFTDESPTDTVTLHATSAGVGVYGMAGDVINMYGPTTGNTHFFQAYPTYTTFGGNSESGFSTVNVYSQTPGDTAQLYEGGSSMYNSKFTSFTSSGTTFTMNGGGTSIVGHGFQEAYGFIQTGDVTWMPSTGVHTLTGTFLADYEQAGSGLGRGDFQGFYYEASGQPGTYGLPTTSVVSDPPGDAVTASWVTFQNGALYLQTGSVIAYDTIEEMSIVQVGTQLTFSWQCGSPTYNVLVGYSLNEISGRIQNQTDRLPTDGSFTLTNVTAGGTYTFQLDTVNPGFLSPNYSGWLDGLSYTAHS